MVSRSCHCYGRRTGQKGGPPISGDAGLAASSTICLGLDGHGKSEKRAASTRGQRVRSITVCLPGGQRQRYFPVFRLHLGGMAIQKSGLMLGGQPIIFSISRNRVRGSRRASRAGSGGLLAHGPRLLRIPFRHSLHLL